MDPAALSAEIMSCLRRAQSKLRAQVTEMVQDTMGDDAAGAVIVQRFAQQFPDPEPPEPTPPEYSRATAGFVCSAAGAVPNAVRARGACAVGLAPAASAAES